MNNEISIKNADFHAEFKYDKLTANILSQKSYKQKKGQKSSLLCFYSYTAILYGVSLFWVDFFVIFSKVLNLAKHSAS